MAVWALSRLVSPGSFEKSREFHRADEIDIEVRQREWDAVEINSRSHFAAHSFVLALYCSVIFYTLYYLLLAPCWL